MSIIWDKKNTTYIVNGISIKKDYFDGPDTIKEIEETEKLRIDNLIKTTGRDIALHLSSKSINDMAILTKPIDSSLINAEWWLPLPGMSLPPENL
jgi:hypothetical protein